MEEVLVGTREAVGLDTTLSLAVEAETVDGGGEGVEETLEGVAGFLASHGGPALIGV